MRQKERDFWMRLMGSDGSQSESEEALTHPESQTHEISITASDSDIKTQIAGLTPAISLTTPSILTIPPDVQISIFELAVDEDERKIDQLTQLSQVCRVWRSIVIGDMPNAWSTIDVRSQKGFVQLVELWLIRTGNSYPLKLAIYHECDIPDLLNTLLPYSSRWYSVRLMPDKESPFSFANPQNRVGGVNFKLQDNPALERFWREINSSKQLGRVFWRDVIPQSTPWAQIEHVGVVCDGTHRIIDVLPQLTRLVMLYARFNKGYGAPAVDGPPVQLPHLRTLSVMGCPTMRLLDHIIAPSLQDLHVDISVQYPRMMGEHCLPYLRGFLKNSVCRLERLALNLSFTIDERNLDPLLRYMGHKLETLQEFILECVSLPDDTVKLLDISVPSEASVLPSLQSFSFKGCFPSTPGLFGSMIQSRFLHGPLRSVYLNIRGGKNTTIHDQDVSILKSLKEEGRDVTLFGLIPVSGDDRKWTRLC